MPFLFISRRSNFLRPLIARHKNKSKHSATYVCKPQNKLLVSENLADKATPLLRAALKANPLLELDAAQYPPKLRKHFARIRSAWAQEPKNNFLIRSQPEQAVVFMEGQSLGLTPLHLLNYVSEGTYRLWLQKDNVRTTTRWITVDDKTVSINFDFQTQYYFDAVKQVFHLQPATINLHEFTQNYRPQPYHDRCY